MDSLILPLAEENLSDYADVIRKSFATVARDFALTKDNYPRHTSFISDDQLKSKISSGYYPFGLYIEGIIVGFVSLTDMENGVFEMNHFSVLPEYRHYGYGKKLLCFCKNKVIELGGNKIIIEIIEENTVLKKWYIANEFTHIEAKQYEGVPFTVGHMEWEIKKNSLNRLLSY